MKPLHIKDGGKKLAVLGLIAGALTAGLRTRQQAEEAMMHGGPAKFSWGEWKRALVETKNALGSKNLPTLAAGVAYYSTLAFFPFLAAAVALAALLITPHQLKELVGAIEVYLPGDVSQIIARQLHILVARRTDNALAATVAIIVALISASGASKNLVIASNVAYGVKESRGWLAQQLWGIVWTISGILYGFILMALLAVNRTILHHFGITDGAAAILLYGRWIVIVACAVMGLAIFYRYGPNRSKVRWHWVSWGAVIATIVWLAGTMLFFLYVQKFANYSTEYSLFAGIIILMIWLNLSALIVLLGAEINHRLETVGRERHERLSGLFSR